MHTRMSHARLWMMHTHACRMHHATCMHTHCTACCAKACCMNACYKKSHRTHTCCTHACQAQASRTRCAPLHINALHKQESTPAFTQRQQLLTKPSFSKSFKNILMSFETVSLQQISETWASIAPFTGASSQMFPLAFLSVFKMRIWSRANVHMRFQVKESSKATQKLVWCTLPPWAALLLETLKNQTRATAARRPVLSHVWVCVVGIILLEHLQPSPQHNVL
jgi:hypothetical protein